MLVILFCGFSSKSCTIPSDNPFLIVQNKNKKLIKMPDIQWDSKKKPGLQAKFVSPAVSEQFHSQSTYCQVNKSQEITRCKPTLINGFFYFHFLFPFLRNFERLGLDYLKKVKPMLSDLSTYLSKVRILNTCIVCLGD